MTAADPANCAPPPAKYSVALNGLHGILRTRWLEATDGRTPARGLLIQAYAPDQRPSNHVVSTFSCPSRGDFAPVSSSLFRDHPSNCAPGATSGSRTSLPRFASSSITAPKESNEASAAAVRATTTKSKPLRHCGRRNRIASRRRRLTRFRTTAPPTFLLTVTPTRTPSCRGNTCSASRG